MCCKFWHEDDCRFDGREVDWWRIQAEQYFESRDEVSVGCRICIEKKCSWLVDFLEDGDVVT